MPDERRREQIVAIELFRRTTQREAPRERREGYEKFRGLEDKTILNLSLDEIHEADRRRIVECYLAEIERTLQTGEGQDARLSREINQEGLTLSHLIEIANKDAAHYQKKPFSFDRPPIAGDILYWRSASEDFKMAPENPELVRQRKAMKMPANPDAYRKSFKYVCIDG